MTKLELIGSLSCAFLHLLLEAFVMYRQAVSFQVGMHEYAVTCLNGRVEWVPFLFKLDHKNVKIDFTKISSKCCCCLEAKNDFQLDEVTVNKFWKELYNKNRWDQNITIYLGDAIKLVDYPAHQLL